MATVSTPLATEARSIFDDLGYEIAGDGPEFRARRAWKDVRVTTVTDPDDTSAEDGLCCFVAWADEVSAIEERISRSRPGSDWAILGVREDGEYRVVRGD